MLNVETFPIKETNLNLCFQALASFIVANRVGLYVSTINQTIASTQHAAWDEVFQGSQNINARTKSIVENNIDKKKLMAKTRKHS